MKNQSGIESPSPLIDGASHPSWTRGLGLLTGAVLWTGLTGWVLFGGLGHGVHGQPEPDQGGQRGAARALRRVTDRAAGFLFDHRGEPTPAVALREMADRLGVSEWHRAGFRGRGVKVAILDSGFQGYRKALGSALPERVEVKSFRKDENLEARESQHGILCGEVVHQLAPEAELLFANWEPESPDQFLEAVRWARRQGARVVSCSLIMPTWSDGEGGGPVHRALNEALGKGDGKGDGLFFASAGNTALRHWGGAYHPGHDGWHEWAPGHKDNLVRPVGRERLSIELSAPAGVGYEMVVRDVLLNREMGRSRSRADEPTSCLAVRFDPHWGHRYAVRVRVVEPAKGGAKSPPPHFHLAILGGRLTHATREGSISFPGDGPEVIAVGAVDWSGERMAYSSCGPNSACPKPDLVAAVPFPSAWRLEQPFAGTSAAAPQGAALAALIWSRQPDRTAADVRLALQKGARSLKGGHDPEKGHGLLHLP